MSRVRRVARSKEGRSVIKVFKGNAMRIRYYKLVDNCKNLKMVKKLRIPGQRISMNGLCGT